MPVGKHSPNSEKWLFMPIKAIQTEEHLAQPQQLMTHNICSAMWSCPSEQIIWCLQHLLLWRGMTDGLLSLRPSPRPSGFFHVLHFVDKTDPSAMQQRLENASPHVSTSHLQNHWTDPSLFSYLSLDLLQILLLSFFLGGFLGHTQVRKVSDAPPESGGETLPEGIYWNQNPGPWLRPWCWRAGGKTLLATLWTLTGLSCRCHSSCSISAPLITCLFQFACLWPSVPPSLPPLHSSLALTGTPTAGCTHTLTQCACACVCAVGGKKWSLPLLHHSFLSLILSLPPSPGPINL